MNHSKKALFTSLIVASSVLFVGCAHTNTSVASDNKVAVEKHTNSEDQTKSESSKEATAEQTAAVEKKDNATKTTTARNHVTANQDKATKIDTNDSVQTKKAPVSSLTFHIEEKGKYTPQFPSSWKTSSSSPYQAAIDGRGENAGEEGQGTILVENTDTEHTTLYSLTGAVANSQTPKFVEWKNNHILYVIIGYPYGTISEGGNLYELNIDTHALTPVIINLPKKEEIISVYKNSNNVFMYKKNVYTDDNFTKSYIVEGKVPEGQN
ncbi:DUF4652 domain-containing protein [Heyndrickxia acidicola]|uniref:DUF4652 domain-containing protein n=1 Tax=Heyndrickxia acidicola TaxID=209389 RepID=A0ABU6MD72_9BACI|nr:DUF4652 domain-containing protein [Heyndrickxia acidicola]MED1202368.1 DUF4652 domain-containing protein [Heyndrickxia acidicola]